MKSSYELAMDRLNKTTPTTKLTAAQKAQIAELESKCKAKIAERELALRGEINQAAIAGETAKREELQQRLVLERQKLQADLEDKKAAVREAR